MLAVFSLNPWFLMLAVGQELSSSAESLRATNVDVICWTSVSSSLEPSVSTIAYSPVLGLLVMKSTVSGSSMEPYSPGSLSFPIMSVVSPIMEWISSLRWGL